MARIGVVGTTSWGTTLGVILAREGHDVTLWARTQAEADSLTASREHRFLPGIEFPPRLSVAASPEDGLSAADIVIIAVPSTTLRENVRRIGGALAGVQGVVSGTKGVEVGTGKRPTELITEELAATGTKTHVGALSGPNLAPEIARGQASSATVAFADPDEAREAQNALNSSLFRVYTTDDIVGVELGGALKNIIAIGAGIIDGLEIGNNAKAAFLTRGLAEITRLGVAMGARPETFAGLSGLGDLVATCFSSLSRNRHVGERLASGLKLPEIQAEMEQTAEGVPTTRAAIELARRYGVEMPITELTGKVLFDGLDPRQAMDLLMHRAPVAESSRSA